MTSKYSFKYKKKFNKEIIKNTSIIFPRNFPPYRSG